MSILFHKPCNLALTINYFIIDQMTSSLLKEEIKKRTNQEQKKAIELDESGKQINQYMPQFITQVPWYVDQTNKPTLKHHKLYEQEKPDINLWYERGSKGAQANTFRKGACQNCGAMGHKRKECAQRPRKLGARFTKRDIQPDDVVKEVELDWEGKRDRWNGYNAEKHKDIVVEYQMYEEIKKKKMLEQTAEGEQAGIDDQYKGVFDPLKAAKLQSRNNKIDIRYLGLQNLRNRDDPAKYLLNLDTNSAHFDPKSRSMRQNPNPLLPEEKQLFKGQNFYLNTGEKNTLLEQQKFAWEQYQINNAELNTVALPSLTQQIYKTVKQKNQILNSGKTGELLKKYGGQQYLKNRPSDDIIETQAYFQYAIDGRIKKLKNQNKIKSKYEEDVFINDHTSVWGSWWNQTLGWGYICCHGTTKMSMCLGVKGKQIALQKEYRMKKEKVKLELQTQAKLKEEVEEKPSELQKQAGELPKQK